MHKSPRIAIQGGSGGGNADSNIILPIQYTKDYKILATGTATGQGYYTFLTAIKTNLASFKLNTYSGAGQLMAHNYDWFAVGR
nr:MAG TPA: hypothetical protein [Caudoviricetes sp.]